MIWARAFMWLALVSLFGLSGAGIGLLIDNIFFQLSFDYVYRSQQFLVNASKVGLFLGTLVAASATTGASSRPRLKHLAIVWVAILTAAGTAGLACAILGAALEKTGLAGPAADGLVPRARVWFCESLWIGALIGSIAATIAGSFRLIRHRWNASEQP